MSIETATILHKMNQLGTLPHYVSHYIDLNTVEAIALMYED